MPSSLPVPHRPTSTALVAASAPWSEAKKPSSSPVDYIEFDVGPGEALRIASDGLLFRSPWVAVVEDGPKRRRDDLLLLENFGARLGKVGVAAPTGSSLVAFELGDYDNAVTLYGARLFGASFNVLRGRRRAPGPDAAFALRRCEGRGFIIVCISGRAVERHLEPDESVDIQLEKLAVAAAGVLVEPARENGETVADVVRARGPGKVWFQTGVSVMPKPVEYERRRPPEIAAVA